MTSTMVRSILAIVLIGGALAPASAETEGFAYQCDGALCFWRRPIVDAPAGWVKDEQASHYFKFNAIARQGEVFTEADAVMLVQSIYRRNAAPTLAEHMNESRTKYLDQNRSAKVVAGKPVTNADGKRLETLVYAPAGTEDDWQTIAFDEEGDYYLVFALIARTRAGHDKSLPALVELVRGYSKTPKSR